ncbi:MAG: sodium-translocating pyrophosphatase [Candidatus Bathyarchaeota archaeon]|nr:sodium-translocating pyrophosphatase [Candidatus Bathyarchaeota archaeon]
MYIPLQALTNLLIDNPLVFWIAPIAGVIAVVASLILMQRIGKMSPGGPKTVEVGNAIREGAYAFLKRQYKTIAIITVIIFALLWVALPTGPFGVGTAAAFLVGAVASLAAGYIAMDNATKANVRTVAAAKQFGAEKALKTAFYGGATMGMAVVGLSLLGVSFLFLLYGGYNAMFGTLTFTEAAELGRSAASGIVGMGFGASLIALFAQLGGGIYTKAADVGADLVGKVEAGIPEDDPRNPAVIADNVGDNVGDSAGRGADLFESATGENIGGMIIGGLISIATGNLIFLVFPLIARALGIFATLVGMPFVKLSEKEAKHPMKALRKGLMVTTIVSGILFLAAVMLLFPQMGENYLGNLYLYGCLLAGLAASVAIDYITDYYTGRDRGPVKKIAQASETGSATNIITGFAVGLETTALPIVSLVIALLTSYWLGTQFGLQIGIDPFIGGIYGTTLATMGMLAVMGMVLALDGFGPIADNAAGIAEMSGEGGAEATMEALDAVGNTTKALTKGFALGSALLAAQLLFQTYIEEVHLAINNGVLPANTVVEINIANPAVLVAAFIGAMIPFFFSSQAISAVGKAAAEMVAEVRRQFREIPGIMEGTGKPEYGKAVDISTKSALRGMVVPALIVVVVPIIVGVLLGPAAVGALVIGATLSAVPLALLMNTGGGAWDNAKKYIEAGHLGGKGSPAHAAAVVGDTVGDPMKDTAGPSLHVLIKLLSTLSIVFIPLFFNLLQLIH